jgi:hypothetical protein
MNRWDAGGFSRLKTSQVVQASPRVVYAFSKGCISSSKGCISFLQGSYKLLQLSLYCLCIVSNGLYRSLRVLLLLHWRWMPSHPTPLRLTPSPSPGGRYPSPPAPLPGGEGSRCCQDCFIVHSERNLNLVFVCNKN